jgi:Fe-S-cluster-containing dehydrogenase component
MDEERCIGCKMCVQACPFGVITVSVNGTTVLKCDLCAERLAKGEQPACVYACPTKALTFDDAEESNREKRRRAAALIVEAEREGNKEIG